MQYTHFSEDFLFNTQPIQRTRSACLDDCQNRKVASTTSCFNAIYATRSTLFAGAETGLQWLPLRVPGNVRLIVTATHPDRNYLQLHERKIRQHMMMNPHQGLTSQSSRASSPDDGGETNTTTTTANVDCMGATIREELDTKGDGEAEYESSHRRRKVCRPTHAGKKADPPCCPSCC